MSHTTTITVVSDPDQPAQEDCEVEFDCFSFRDTGTITVRHNVCEGVMLLVELTSVMSARGSFVLDDEDLDGMIAALQEAKRRKELVR